MQEEAEATSHPKHTRVREEFNNRQCRLLNVEAQPPSIAAGYYNLSL